MAQGVVDRFETVEIDEQDTQLAIAPQGEAEVLIKAVAEGGAVGECG